MNMRPAFLFQFGFILCLALILASCSEDQAVQGPTGPPAQPDTAWAQQMGSQHKEKQKIKLAGKYKRLKKEGLRLADEPERRAEAITYLNSALNLAEQAGIKAEERQPIKKRLAELVRSDKQAKELEAASKKASESEAAKAKEQLHAQTMVARKGEVLQPGESRLWLRCPIGQRWTGKSCKGKIKWIKWFKADDACPEGYRLPTRLEFVTLLGDCDEKVREANSNQGFCNNCANSKPCRSMFGKDKHSYWSASSFTIGTLSAWFGNFSNGNIGITRKPGQLNVRCLRGGP